MKLKLIVWRITFIQYELGFTSVHFISNSAVGDKTVDNTSGQLSLRWLNINFLLLYAEDYHTSFFIVSCDYIVCSFLHRLYFSGALFG